MKALILEKNRKREWEAFLRDTPHSIAWHEFEWSEILKRHYSVDFYPIAACEENRIVGVLPLYRIKTAFSPEILVSIPYVVAGGVVSERPDAQRIVLEKAIEISESHGSCRIVLKQYKVRMEGDFLTDGNYHNRELPLSGDIGSVWEKLAEKNRRMIESTGEMKLDLVHPSEDVKEFHRLLLKSQHGKGIPCVSRRWIEDLLRFRFYSIAFLKKDGKVVAGTLIKEYKKAVSFPFTFLAGKTEGNIPLAYRLYWELIRLYARKGCEIFHSGRIPNNEAVEEYRLGWGGTKYPYYYQYYPNRGGQTEYVSKRGWKRDLLGRCWKLLPAPVAEAIGPLVVKEFP